MAIRASKRNWENKKTPSGKIKSSGRKAGEGWKAEWKLRNGKWKSKSTFRTKEQALEYARRMEIQVGSGTAELAGQKMTVRELVAKFEESLELRRSREFITGRHVINTMGHVRNYLLGEEAPRSTWRGARPVKLDHYLADWTLQSVVETDNVAVDLRDALLATKLDTGTVKGVLGSISRTFKFALTRKWIKENPFAGIGMETPRGERNKRRYPPSQASFSKVLSLSSDPFKLILEVCAGTGLREGEVRALRNRDVKFKERTISVKVAVGEGNIIGPPKSASSIRDIPISTTLASRLAAHMKVAEFSNPSNQVFPTEAGELRAEGFGLEGMDALIADLDWPKQQGEAGPEELARFTFHGLRHYAICAWIGAGLGVKAVQTFAGHSSIDQTWDQYGYLFPKEEHWAKIEIASELIYKEAPQIADKMHTKRQRSGTRTKKS